MAQKGFKLEEEAKLSDGMRTPPGYFHAFNHYMPEKLPFNELAESPDKIAQGSKTWWWQTARPFFYMAAMFMGVWCMTKMFSLMKEQSPALPFGDNAVIASALSNNDFYNDYVVNSVDEYDLLTEIFDNCYIFIGDN